MLGKLFKFLLTLALGFALGVGATLYVAAKHGGGSGRPPSPSPAPQTASRPAQTVPASPAPPASPAASAQVRLLDFGAEWCAPCKVQDPIIENLAADYSGRVTVTKIDVDKNPQFADRYSVQAVPTLIIERNGREAKRFTGLQEERVLAQALEDALR